jgi:hypothetical protein
MERPRPNTERALVRLTNSAGNHGEDVKECCFYLYATPMSSYLKMLYKYPQAEYPYNDLVATNRSRGKQDPEYELLDMGVFDGDRISMSRSNTSEGRRRTPAAAVPGGHRPVGASAPRRVNRGAD